MKYCNCMHILNFVSVQYIMVTVPLCGIDLLRLTKYTTFKKLVLLEKLSFLEHCLMAIAPCYITRKRLGSVKF